MTIKRLLGTDDVEDNLTSTYSDVPLSAKQGKVLKGLIDTIPSLPTATKAGTIAVYNGTNWVTQEGYGYYTNKEDTFKGNVTCPSYTGDWYNTGINCELKENYRVMLSALSLMLVGNYTCYADSGYAFIGNIDGSGKPALSEESPVTLRTPVGGGNLEIGSLIPLSNVYIEIISYVGIKTINGELLPVTDWSSVYGKPFGDIVVSNGLFVNGDENLDVRIGDEEGTLCAGNDERFTGMSEHISDTNNPHSVTAVQIGAQPTITTESKLSSDLVDDTSGTNKFVTGTEKTAWNGKQNALPDVFLQAIPANANLVKSNKDSSGVYLTYTWDLTTAITGYPAKWVSTLSADYLTRTLTVYGSDKTTVLATYTFTRTLDADGCLLTETLNTS